MAVVSAPTAAPAGQPEPPDQTEPAPDVPTWEGTEEDEDDVLGQKLLRRAARGSDEDIMSEIIRLMEESAQRIERSFDPGPRTQRTQELIVKKLDEAIRQAAMQRRPRPSPSSSSDRRSGQPQPDPSESKDRQDRSAQQPADAPTDSEAMPGGLDTVGTTTGIFLDARRGWGHLPERDRDEVIQGSGERFLERYRDWIERYYRALQEAE